MTSINIKPFPKNMWFSTETLNQITSDLTVIRQETIANIVMGKVSVEDGLASLKAEEPYLALGKVLLPAKVFPIQTEMYSLERKPYFYIPYFHLHHNQN